MSDPGFALWTSFAAVIFFMVLLGVLSALKVKTSSDFSLGGRRMSSLLVSASLMGTFVGGTSIVGTAQASFLYGISGIWFTLGAGLSCLMLALFLAGPLRRSGVETIPELLLRSYDRKTALWASFYTSIGIFIQVATQLLAAVPLMSSLFNIPPAPSALLVTLLVLCSVVFGGFWGATLIGLLKMFLLYFTLIAAVFILFHHTGGIGAFWEAFPRDPWLNLWARGAARELGAAFSVLVGFASTQSYLQSLFAARDVPAARKGALIASIFIPLAGAGSALIGMYMSRHHTEIIPGEALPLFVLEYVPPVAGGVMLATLLITLIMTSAGLTLGLGTMINRNFYRDIFRPDAGEREQLMAFRIIVVVIAMAAFFFTMSTLHVLILTLAFISMALRGVTVFLPLLGAIFYSHRIPPASARNAVIVAPAASLCWALFLPDFLDPIYIGLLISFLVLSRPLTKITVPKG